MPFYSIASLTVEADMLPQSFQPFLIQESGCAKKADLSFVHVMQPHFTGNLKKAAELSNMTIWKEESSGSIRRWIYESRQGMGTFSVDADYSAAEYYFLDFFSRFSPMTVRTILSPFFQLIIQCKMIRNGFSVLHAACVEKDGIAYAFSGPSGIGKSSRAQKWRECLAAEWISGDRPALEGSRRTVYGVPWDGSEGIYRSVSCPLGAILKLQRSHSTKLAEMTEKEKLQLLSEQSLFPLWDAGLAANALHSIKVLTKNVPIYELSCDITDESTYQAHELILRSLNK